MRRFSHAKLALVGLTVAAPLSAQAGEIPSYSNGGYRTPAQTVGKDGRLIKATPTAATAAASPGVTQAMAPGQTMVMTEAQARAMVPPGKIVACAHSKAGVCPACQAVLDMPGTVTVLNSGAPTPAPTVASAPAGAVLPSPSDAPGRAVAMSEGPSPVQHAHGAAMGLSSPDEGPTPIGVVQTNFQNGAQAGMMGPQGTTGMMGPQGMPPAGSTPFNPMMGPPGRAMAGGGDPMSMMGGAPYQTPRKSLRPNILGHLFGWSYIGKDWRESRDFARDQARSKSRAAAAMASMNGGSATAPNEIPAGMVYGRGR